MGRLHEYQQRTQKTMDADIPPSARRAYAFGPFVADCRKRLLWRDGALVSLTPKAFEILAVLIEHRGRVVDKDEVLMRVWGDVAVEDATLARHISTLRRVLDERPNQHLYIVTVPGRGYEFVAVISEVEHDPVDPRDTDQSGEDDHLLDPAMEAVAPHVAAQAPGPRRWVPFAIASVFAVVVAAGVLMALDFRRSQARAPQRTLRQFTFRGGLQREAAWSPDGRSVAYTSDAAGSSDIWVQNVADAQAARVTASPAEDSQPDWSPDGQSLVFRSERDGGGLFVVPARGGLERQIANFGYKPRWSPDGTLILFTSSGHLGGASRIYLVGRDGGTARLLRPDVLADVNVSAAAWKPDGSGVSILGRRAATGWIFMTVPPDRGNPVISVRRATVGRQVQEEGLMLGRFTWSRSGQYLYFEGLSERVRNLWRITVDPATQAWIAGPDRLTTGAGQDGDVAISPDGTRLIFSARSSRTRVWTFPFDEVSGKVLGAGESVTSGGAGEQDADSPSDGSKLVYSAIRSGREELWERSMLDGRERLLISTTGWRRSRPRWSPDGLRLAYNRSRADPGGGRMEAVAVLPVGGEERLLTKPGQVSLTPSDWSPDGAWLLGSCLTGTPRRVGVCVLPVSDRMASDASLRVVTSHPAKNMFESRFSPDQRWISFIGVDTADARASRIYVVPVSGGEWRPVTEGLWYDDKPHWSRDGRTLYFVSDRNGMFNVWGRRFDSPSGAPVGEPFQVTSFASPRQTISPELGRMQIAVTTTHLFLPITETSAELWLLDNVNR